MCKQSTTVWSLYIKKYLYTELCQASKIIYDSVVIWKNASQRKPRFLAYFTQWFVFRKQKLEQRKTNQNTKLKCDIVMELYTQCTYQLTYSQRSCDIREVIGRSVRLKFWSVPTGEFPLRLRHSGFVIICRTLTGRPTKIIGEMIKSYYFICQICQRLDYFAIFVIFRIIPVNIYFFKVTMETLEKGVKYVQS